jgi:hypothetical protein
MLDGTPACVRVIVNDHTSPTLAQLTGTFFASVYDITPPLLALPQTVTAEATSAAGAVVEYAATVTDNVDPAPVVTCDRASGQTFAIGQTIVTCTATDAAKNAATASFTVTVADVTTPGVMSGNGFIKEGGARYEFNFRVVERAEGTERGHLRVEISSEPPKGRASRARKERDRFVARDIAFVAFSDDPTHRPGRRRRPQVDTVLFSGTGTWNGDENYRFEVFASDEGEPGRHRESVRVTIWSPSGAAVAHVEGTLDGGNVQSRRIRH